MNQLLEYRYLIPLALFLGLAPFFPQPHIVEKIKMLAEGTLKRPIDIFDLFWHSWPFVLLAYKLVRDIMGRVLSSINRTGGTAMQWAELPDDGNAQAEKSYRGVRW